MRAAWVLGTIAICVMLVARIAEKRSSWWILVGGIAGVFATICAFLIGWWPPGLALLAVYLRTMYRWVSRAEREL